MAEVETEDSVAEAVEEAVVLELEAEVSEKSAISSVPQLAFSASSHFF